MSTPLINEVKNTGLEVGKEARDALLDADRPNPEIDISTKIPEELKDFDYKLNNHDIKQKIYTNAEALRSTLKQLIEKKLIDEDNLIYKEILKELNNLQRLTAPTNKSNPQEFNLQEFMQALDSYNKLNRLLESEIKAGEKITPTNPFFRFLNFIFESTGRTRRFGETYNGQELNPLYIPQNRFQKFKNLAKTLLIVTACLAVVAGLIALMIFVPAAAVVAGILTTIGIAALGYAAFHFRDKMRDIFRMIFPNPKNEINDLEGELKTKLISGNVIDLQKEIINSATNAKNTQPAPTDVPKTSAFEPTPAQLLLQIAKVAENNPELAKELLEQYKLLLNKEITTEVQQTATLRPVTTMRDSSKDSSGNLKVEDVGDEHEADASDASKKKPGA